MNQLFLTNFYIYIFLSIWGGAGTPSGKESHQEMACIECHSDLIEKDVIHYPAEDACDNCHESTGLEHPGDSTGFTLMDQPPKLCYYCHEEGSKTNHPHKPVSDGKCLECHDAHGSPNEMLLKSPDKELCLSCHNKKYETDSSLTINIDRLVTGKMIAHSAIEGGGCLACHKAHGSDYQNLLVDLYPTDDYVEVRIAEFGLCFQCHDSDLLMAEETEWGTNFRNGTQNLHWLHTNGNKGRSCSLCHNLHGSDQSFLIEERVPFGSWEMRMKYIPEAQGGSCLPGCHSRLSYSRQL